MSSKGNSLPRKHQTPSISRLGSSFRMHCFANTCFLKWSNLCKKPRIKFSVWQRIVPSFPYLSQWKNQNQQPSGSYCYFRASIPPPALSLWFTIKVLKSKKFHGLGGSQSSSFCESGPSFLTGSGFLSSAAGFCLGFGASSFLTSCFGIEGSFGGLIAAVQNFTYPKDATNDGSLTTVSNH